MALRLRWIKINFVHVESMVIWLAAQH